MTPSEPHAPKKRYMLEKQQPFGQSLLWEIQRHYYASKGVDAWRQMEVPHYITNNPFIANSYAEIVFALLRDQNRLAPGATSKVEPIHICELGAGSGRFAFHFLKRLLRLCERGRISPASFRYVLTDQAENNLRFWREHPRFQPFFESGLLDIAPFEVNESTELSLLVSRSVIIPGSLERPLVVIANYLLDSIPQDLYLVNEHGFHRCLVSLMLEKDPNILSVSEVLDDLELHYGYEPLTEEPYDEPWLQQIFDSYRGALTNTHLTIPATGLRCLRRLKALSKTGLMLLSADKGTHRLSALEGRSIPGVVRHRSVSLSVNYHAIKMHVEQTGGFAMFPDTDHKNVNVSCSLMLPEASNHIEVRQAYRRHVADFGPDDFYTIVHHAEDSVPRMTLQQLTAYLRLGHYDSDRFIRYLMRLIELAPDLNRQQCDSFIEVIERVWDLYFPLGEIVDLAHGIGCILYRMNEYARALTYFEISITSYGENAGTFLNVALCCQNLKQWEKAKASLEKILASEPENQSALELMATCAAQEKAQEG
jgi:tetratricopeptide (TPR) repeat protein